MTIAISTSARRVRLSIQNFFSRLGNRIVSAGTERIAARDALRRQPYALDRPMFLERFDGVRGAAWIITAGRRKQRAQRDLVAADQKNQHGAHGGLLARAGLARNR